MSEPIDLISASKLPRLVASTQDIYNGGIAGAASLYKPDAHGSFEPGENDITSGLANPKESNYFRSAQWSPDGTSLLTSSADNVLRTFILPTDLLSTPEPHILRPYTSHVLPSALYATAIHPKYDLSTVSITVFVASLSSLPIRLLSPFAPGILASYPLINPTTEAYVAPHSLLFDTFGGNTNHFFAGSESEISIFDINRNGEGPMNRMKTIPSRRKKMVGGGVGMKGIVSALGMSRDGLLAAGTFGRWVGLYDGGGRGGTVGVFEIRNHGDDEENKDGAGITQVVWSDCGRYLCVIERASEGIGVWDIRGTGQRLSWLSGRKARTMQRLNIDVVGKELWAGGTDGVVRIWDGLGMDGGVLKPSWEFRAHDDAISSVAVHPSGIVFATSSGQRHTHKMFERKEPDAEDGTSGGSGTNGTSIKSDNSLKVWERYQPAVQP